MTLRKSQNLPKLLKNFRSAGATMIESRNEIQVQASETGKWYSINGAIVGGTISSIVAPLILKLLHLS